LSAATVCRGRILLSDGGTDREGRRIVVPEVSDQPWSRVTRGEYASAVEFCAACLIDENPVGGPKTKSRCKLPVYEPRQMGGLLNRNAVRAAAARLVATRGGVLAPPTLKRLAAQRLMTLFGQLGEQPPPSLATLGSPEDGPHLG
jgi:hypothetical protein